MAKKYILILSIILLLQASSVFSQAIPSAGTELNYPAIPGTVAPQDIVQRPTEEQFPLFVNYIVKLFFIIAVGLVIAVLIYAGLLYINSGAKPALMATAKQRIQQAILGLIIIICSYLLLYTINPQLVVLRLKAPTPYSLPTAYMPVDDKIVFYQIPAASQLSDMVAYLDEEVQTQWGTRRVEIPFLRTLEALDEAIELTQELQSLLDNCQCGESQVHVKFKGTKGKCEGGKDVENPSCEDKTTCTNCGTINCDLRELETEEIKNDQGEVIKINVKIDGRLITEADKATSINYKRMLLQKTLTKLQTYNTELSTEQIAFLSNALTANMGNFLGAELSGILFQEDFEAARDAYTTMGYTVKTELIEQFPEPQSVRMSPETVDPLTMYAIKIGPPEIVAYSLAMDNQSTMRHGQRASVSDVLSQLSLEDVQDMVDECFDSAFGQGDFLIDAEDFNNLVEQGIKESTFGYYSELFTGEKDELANIIANDIEENIHKKIEAKATETNRIEKCKNELCTSDQKPANQSVPQCQASCTNTDTIPPRFLSNYLTDLLTRDIRERLPDEIQKMLKQKLRDIIFSKELNKILDDDIIYLLDNVLQGALTKSLEEQIPFLKENLRKQVYQILPDLILDPLQAVDVFLITHLSNLKQRVAREVEHVANVIGNEIIKAVSQSFEGYRMNNPNLFRENFSAQECFDYERQGFYFNGDKCVRASLDQINAWNISLFNDFTQEEYCRRANYCWDELDNECEECQWIDISSLAPTKENIARLGQEFMAGLINFAEQFIVALTRTAVYTLGKYAQVWIEDEIIAPIQPYLSQLTEFQQKLHKFLNSAVKDLLPPQLSKYLVNNIDYILNDICNKAKADQPIKLYRGMEEITISKKIGNKACSIHEKFHESLLDKLKKEEGIGEDIVMALETTVEQLLPKNWRDILNKSFAELLWPSITNIKELINGTPKEIICGDLYIQKTGQGLHLASECEKARARQAFELIPYANTNSDAWDKMTGSEQAFCYFRWYACKSPVSRWQTNIGGLIEQILRNQCSRIRSHCVTSDCNTCEDKYKKACFSCEFLVDRSLDFSGFDYLIQTYYGNVENNNKEQAKQVYEWLLSSFPDLSNQLRILALHRGMSSGEWSIVVTNVDSGRTGAADLITQWFATNNTLKETLITPQLGVMTYLKGENYMGKNFLSRTPYQFLHHDVCPKIKKDFAEEYPEWTVAQIISRESSYGSQYSVAGLNKPGVSTAIEKLMASNVPDKDRTAYLTCILLDSSLAQATGLDKALVRYIYPQEYQILFDLINDKLTSNERPDALNNLLDYIYTKTPADALEDLSEQGSSVNNFAKLIKLQLGSIINQGLMQEQMIVLMFRHLYPLKCAIPTSQSCPLNNKIGWHEWDEIQRLLGMTPAQLIKDSLNIELLKNIDLDSNFTIMGYIADKILVLKQPYVDTLGKALHLTGVIKKIYLEENKVTDSINKAVRNTKNTIQDSFDTAFLEYPPQAVSWLAKGLANIVGINLGNKISEQLVGQCRDATAQEINTLSCSPGQVFKQETKQCCSMGEALVCTPQCRVPCTEKPSQGCSIEAGEIELDNMCCTACKTEIGEIEKDGMCCFDSECNICHEPKMVAETIACPREDEKKKNDLCCKTRERKDDQCCVDIVACMAEKFSSFLEFSLGRALMEGPSVNMLRPNNKAIINITNE